MPVNTPVVRRFRIAGAAPVAPTVTDVPAITTRADGKGNVDIMANGTVIAYVSSISGTIVLKAGNPRTVGLTLDAKGRVKTIKENTRRTYGTAAATSRW